MLINSFHIEIECKTGSGKLSQAQKNWRDMILKTGHHFIDARSLEQATAEIKNILNGGKTE